MSSAAASRSLAALTRLSARLSAGGVGFLRMLLRGYRVALSPLFGPSCRYIPTCSCYADEALEKWGGFSRDWSFGLANFALSSILPRRTRSSAAAAPDLGRGRFWL